MELIPNVMSVFAVIKYCDIAAEVSVIKRVDGAVTVCINKQLVILFLLPLLTIISDCHP